MTRFSRGRWAAGVTVGRGEEERGDGDLVGAVYVGAGVGLVFVVDGTLTDFGWVALRGGNTGMCLGLVSVTVVGGDLAGTVVVVGEGTVVVVVGGTVVVVDEGTVVVVVAGTVVVEVDVTVVVEAGTVVGGTLLVVVVVTRSAPLTEGT